MNKDKFKDRISIIQIEGCQFEEKSQLLIFIFVFPPHKSMYELYYIFLLDIKVELSRILCW